MIFVIIYVADYHFILFVFNNTIYDVITNSQLILWAIVKGRTQKPSYAIILLQLRYAENIGGLIIG
jgi:hypothetical protein